MDEMSEEVLLLAAQAKAWTEIGVLHTAQNVKRLPLLLLQTIFTAEDTVKELIGRVFLGHRTKSQLSRAERIRRRKNAVNISNSRGEGEVVGEYEQQIEGQPSLSTLDDGSNNSDNEEEETEGETWQSLDNEGKEAKLASLAEQLKALKTQMELITNAKPQLQGERAANFPSVPAFSVPAAPPLPPAAPPLAPPVPPHAPVILSSSSVHNDKNNHHNHHHNNGHNDNNTPLHGQSLPSNNSLTTIPESQAARDELLEQIRSHRHSLRQRSASTPLPSSSLSAAPPPSVSMNDADNIDLMSALQAKLSALAARKERSNMNNNSDNHSNNDEKDGNRNDSIDSNNNNNNDDGHHPYNSHDASDSTPGKDNGVRNTFINAADNSPPTHTGDNTFITNNSEHARRHTICLSPDDGASLRASEVHTRRNTVSSATPSSSLRKTNLPRSPGGTPIRAIQNSSFISSALREKFKNARRENAHDNLDKSFDLDCSMDDDWA